MANIFDKIREQFKKGTTDLRAKAKGSIKSFAQMAKSLTGKRVAGNEFFRDRERLINRISPIHIGKMVTFYYDPKLKATLPYYDRFPLVIPIEIYDNGFLGLNLHYLPPRLRFILMETLYERVYKVENSNEINEKRRTQISYNILKRISSTRYYAPCVKRYLNNHLVSRIYKLRNEDWEMALYLPTERFEKASKQQIWRESRQKMRRF